MRQSKKTSSSRTGYQDVADVLRREIREGKISEGSLLPTERDLQVRFQTSRTTVRRALQALVDSGWAEASPNRGVLARRGPLSTATKNVAYIDHAETVNHLLFLALNRRFQESGYHLVHVDSHQHGVEGAINYAYRQGFAGAVIWPKTGDLNAELIAESASHMPIVTVRHSFPFFRTDVVTEDSFAGGALATQHLINLGRKRICVTGMLDMLSTNHERFSGYMVGLMRNDQQPTAADYVFCFTSDMAEPDTRLLEYRMRQPDHPDAIFVLDDFLVPYVAEAVERCGLRIPEDVAIVAFGNDAPYEFNGTRLTTVLVNWEKVAEMAVNRLRERLDGDHSPAVTVSIPVELIVRGSCGAPRDQWSDIPFFLHANSFMFAQPEHGRRPWSPDQARVNVASTLGSDRTPSSITTNEGSQP